MALLQISEPGGAGDPHQRRLAIGIDLGTTHSLVAACGTVLPNACRTNRAASSCRPPSAISPDGRREVGRAALRGGRERSGEHHCFGQALHGARAGRHRGPRAPALRLRRRSGHGAVAHRGGHQIAGRGVGRNPCQAAPARGRHLPRRRLRCGGHGTGVFRRCAAPGDQGRRAARRTERAAADQRADGGGDRLRAGERLGRLLRRLRPRWRHLRHLAPASHARCLRGRGHRRRLCTRR